MAFSYKPIKFTPFLKTGFSNPIQINDTRAFYPKLELGETYLVLESELLNDNPNFINDFNVLNDESYFEGTLIEFINDNHTGRTTSFTLINENVEATFIIEDFGIFDVANKMIFNNKNIWHKVPQVVGRCTAFGRCNKSKGSKSKGRNKSKGSKSKGRNKSKGYVKTN